MAVSTHLGRLPVPGSWIVTRDSGGAVTVEHPEREEMIVVEREPTGYYVLHRGPDSPFALSSSREETYPDTWGGVRDVVGDVASTGGFL